MLLEKIQKENDIKQLKPEELEKLAEEIRQFLVEKISVTGGHLASNLGVVELTMALHLAFELPAWNTRTRSSGRISETCPSLQFALECRAQP